MVAKLHCCQAYSYHMCMVAKQQYFNALCLLNNTVAMHSYHICLVAKQQYSNAYMVAILHCCHAHGKATFVMHMVA